MFKKPKASSIANLIYLMFQQSASYDVTLKQLRVKNGFTKMLLAMTSGLDLKVDPDKMWHFSSTDFYRG